MYAGVYVYGYNVIYTRVSMCVRACVHKYMMTRVIKLDEFISTKLVRENHSV